MRWALAWLAFWMCLCLWLGGCEARVCICSACDQRATTDRSDYTRQLDCVRCLESCHE
jgi:hypothetical protein